MNTPNNAKSAASIAAIKQAFTDLVAEKPYQQISVTELCQRASINRTTFYSHFSNTHDVLAALCNDLYQSVVNEILPAGGDVWVLTQKETILQVLFKLQKNKRLYQAYLPELMNSRIGQELVAYTKQKYVLSTLSESAEWKTDYQYEFCVQGVIGVFAKWIAGDCKEEAEQVAELIERLLQRCISGQAG